MFVDEDVQCNVSKLQNYIYLREEDDTPLMCRPICLFTVAWYDNIPTESILKIVLAWNAFTGGHSQVRHLPMKEVQLTGFHSQPKMIIILST